MNCFLHFEHFHVSARATIWPALTRSARSSVSNAATLAMIFANNLLYEIDKDTGGFDPIVLAVGTGAGDATGQGIINNMIHGCSSSTDSITGIKIYQGNTYTTYIYNNTVYGATDSISCGNNLPRIKMGDNFGAGDNASGNILKK